MRQNFSASVFGLFLWLIFVSTGWTQIGGTWQTRPDACGPARTRDWRAKREGVCHRRLRCRW